MRVVILRRVASRVMPAAFTSTSTWPWRATTRATRSVQDCSIGDIERLECHAIAQIRHLFAERGDALGAGIQVGGDHRAARLRQRAADRRAETTNSARDNGDALRHELNP